ncbi:MAG TPA: ankyrin repeat domain-containing protein [Clostridia bacterium]|nr:ankyrin repeat domain-containing protein [Clostridia bacterium]
MRKLVIAVALGTLLLVAACQRTQPLTSSSASEPTITALAIQRQYDRALQRIDAHPELADQADDLGTTPLMAAVSRSPVPIDFVQGLLKRKVDVNRRDKSGVTALMMASGTGDRATVDLLLKNGADATLQDRRGGTALKRAARFRHSEVPSLLMRHGAKPDIFDAAQLGLAKELEAMLREEPSLARRQGEGGRTALLVAAFAGQKDAVRVLLPYNQPLDACAAAATGRIKELGAALADVAVDTRDPATQMPALECAILAGQYEAASLLLQRGADPNGIDDNEQTSPLLVAVRKGDKRMVELLLRHGAEKTRFFPGFGSAHTVALRANRPDIAELLR